MKVLVTGGAGFVASHIVDLLLENTHEVVVVDNLSTGKKENLNPLSKFYNEDIISSNLEQIFQNERPDFVIHHAEQIDVQTSIREPLFDAQANILGTINLLQCCVKYGVLKVVYASSAAVYGNPEYLGVDELHPLKPMSGYGISKHTPEHYLQVYAELSRLKFTVLRYANIYGPRQDPRGEGGVVAIFTHRLLNGVQPVIFGDGKQTRDFIYVKDIALANLAALQQGDNAIYNISCNHATDVNSLLAAMQTICGTQLSPEYQAARHGDILHSYLDNRKAAQGLGWQPRFTLEQGLQETISYYSKP